jgi:hypothetical protein
MPESEVLSEGGDTPPNRSTKPTPCCYHPSSKEFGRDLYSECVDYLVAVAPAQLQALLRAQFLWGQPFGRRNPQAGATDLTGFSEIT